MTLVIVHCTNRAREFFSLSIPNTNFMQGYLSLVLHAHLPFVRHPEHEKFLEEEWLFEAVTETYLPLLEVLEGWRRDGMDTRLTLCLSPTLCAMLRDPLLQDRYVRHLNGLLPGNDFTVAPGCLYKLRPGCLM